MAVGDRSQLPVLPADLQPLSAYLRQRDSGAPTNQPHPRSIEQIHHGGGWREDRLDWDYSDPAATKGVGADGFVLFAAYGLNTEEPQRGGFVIAAAQRKTALIVPNVACSYGIAAFRLTHQGQEQGQKIVPAIWRVEALDSATVGQARGTYELQGAKDGINTEFTLPFRVLIDPDGMPTGQVIFSRAHLIYTTDATPRRGQWTLANPSAGAGVQVIVVGEPPKGEPNADYLAYTCGFSA